MIAPESRAFIVLLGALAMLTSLAVDMSVPALPSLSTVFAASPDTVQLTLSLFFLGYAVGQLLYGPFSDRFGRRRALLAGLGIFTLTGFLSAASWSIEMMIWLRLLHGISAASGPVLARAIVRDHFSGDRAAQGLSAVIAVMSLSPLIAPGIGGLVLTFLGWRAIFLLLGVLGLLLFAATFWGLGESLTHPDHQALHPRRLIANYRAFFANPRSRGFTIVNAIAFAGLFAYISGSPFVLIDVYGLSSVVFGFYFGLSALGFMLGSIANNRLVPRWGMDAMIRLGFAVLVAGGAILLIASWLRLGGPWGIVLPFLVYAFGLGLVLPNATAGAMEPLPHMAGNAAAIVGATQMGTGSVAGYVVNRLYNHSPVPLAVMIALAALVATIFYFLALRARRS